MVRIKSLPRPVWLVAGAAITVLLMPAAAAATSFVYNGIEGAGPNSVSSYKADVTPAAQLLTTEASPKSFHTYGINVYHNVCLSVSGALPSGQAYVAEDLTLDVNQATPPTLNEATGLNESVSNAVLYVANYNMCDNEIAPKTSKVVDELDATNGSVGPMQLELRPGYVLPQGWQFYLVAGDLQGFFTIDGYLVPSADAPTSAQ